MDSQDNAYKSKYVPDVHITVPQVNLRASMRPPNPELRPLLERIAVDRNVMISVFDYAFLPQFYSFYYGSILPLHITNFVAFALDKKTYAVLLPSIRSLSRRRSRSGVSPAFYWSWIRWTALPSRLTSDRPIS